MEFKKTLSKYYQKWYDDCIASAKYCEFNNAVLAETYRQDAARYKEILDKFSKQIEFFSQDDNAFKSDHALPIEFRGYK